MPYPETDEIKIAILEVLNAAGGKGRTKDIYPRVAQHFPHISTEELEKRFGIGEKKWTNIIRWAKLSLVQNGEVTGSGRGVWKITDKGRQKIGKKP